MSHAPESSAEPARTVEAARVTVTLIPKAADNLAALQERTGLSKTDIINRAVTAYDFIDAQILAGRDLLIRDRETGETHLVAFL